MRVRTVLAGSIVFALAGVAYHSWQSGQFARQWDVWTGSSPKIVLPALITLPTHPSGEIVTARFTIENAGNRTLEIGQVRTACSCAGLEREESGTFIRLHRLSVEPGESVALALRIVPRAINGESVRNIIFLRTNDPSRPEVSVEVVIGNVSALPSASPAFAVFDPVVVGNDASQLIEITDSGREPRRIKAAIVTCPALAVDVFDSAPSPLSQPRNHGSQVVGRLRIRLRTEQPLALRTRVAVTFQEDDTPTLIIPVIIAVVPPVSVTPSLITLPRPSAAQPLYWAEVLCQSNENGMLSVTLSSAPSDVTVTISPVADRADQQLVRIELLRNKQSPAQAVRDSSVVLSASVGSNVTPLTVRVLRTDVGRNDDSANRR